MSKQEYCPVKNAECSFKELTLKQNSALTCFIAVPCREEMKTTLTTIFDVLKKCDIEHYMATDEITTGREILCKICQQITTCDFAIVETTYINPNVLFEYGMLLGRRKPVFLLLDNSRTRTRSVPSDIMGLERIQYKNQETLSDKLSTGVANFLRQINIEERTLHNLREISLYYATKNDLVFIDSLLQTIYEKSLSDPKTLDSCVKLIEKVMLEFIEKKDFASSLRFGLSGARIYLKNKDKEHALEFFDEMMNRLAEFVYCSKDKVKKILDAYPQFSNLPSEDPLFLADFFVTNIEIRDFKNPDVTRFFYAILWEGLNRSANPVNWMKKFVDVITPPKQIVERWYNVCRTPWLGYLSFDLLYLTWLQSIVMKYNDNKEALQFAKDSLSKMRKSIDKYIDATLFGLDTEGYDKYIGKPRKLSWLFKKSQMGNLC